MTIFLDDRALLDGFRRGDPDALARVYRAYVDDVAALARRGFVVEAHGHWRVPGAGSADDERELVHETFVRAFAESARASYDGLRPYRPYLLRITKNLLIDGERRRRREVRPLDEAALDQAALDQPDPDDPGERERAATWQRQRALTETFVAGLDDEGRRFVELRFTEGRSQADTAAGLGVTRRRVRTLEARITRALRKYLRRNGEAVE